MSRRILLAAAALLTPLIALGAEKLLPRLDSKDGQTRLIVDGSPYLILGAQVHNSSNANADDLAKALDAVAGLHANVAEVPVYWEAIEPREGQFDFHNVDQAVEAARKRDLRLVLLWFGTWKNGESHYVPEWVKRDKKRFTRVLGARLEETEIISPLCGAAQQADSRAFAAVMRHIRETDESTRTVIMMQVENEPGLLGTDRDYSGAGTSAFDGSIPPELTAYLDKHRAGLSQGMKSAWAGTDYRTTGSWTSIFGELAPEAFSAWNVARYVDAVAAAGKREYPLPMYVNVWLIEGVERAGAWPSGGATEHVLDVWKAAAPSIDILAPDIYYPKFYDICAQYRRPDNVLWVPETNFNPYFAGFIYQVFGYFNGLGFSPFGIDDAQKGSQFEDVYRVLQPLLPLIAKYQYTGKIHPVLQGTAQGEDWKQSIRVGKRLAANVDFTIPYNPEQSRGRGMIIELAPDDFLVVGAGFRVVFRELDGPPRDAQLLSIEEGSFAGDTWMPVRRWNGDERHVALPEKSTVLRVRLVRP
jgi:hypothetical protein